MKLTSELKEKIDTYFNSISPEDLVNKAISVYEFEEILNLSKTIETIEVNNSMDLNVDFDYRSFVTEVQETLSLAA